MPLVFKQLAQTAHFDFLTCVPVFKQVIPEAMQCLQEVMACLQEVTACLREVTGGGGQVLPPPPPPTLQCSAKAIPVFLVFAQVFQQLAIFRWQVVMVGPAPPLLGRGFVPFGGYVVSRAIATFRLLGQLQLA